MRSQSDYYFHQASQQCLNPTSFPNPTSPTNPSPSPNTTPSDQWLDRLTLQNFPIKQILHSIFLRYKEDSGGFLKYVGKRAASLRSCRYKVKNFLPRLPLEMAVGDVVALLVDKYRVSADGARLLVEDFMWVYQEENQVYAELKRKGATVLKYTQGRTNEAVFFCTPQMKQNFQKNGDVVCVDFKPIHIKSIPKSRSYSIGVFIGHTTNFHHSLFGISLLAHQTRQNYRIAVQQFLRAMRVGEGCGYPESFVVGGDEVLFGVVEEMGKGGTGTGMGKGKGKGKGGRLFGCLMGWSYLMEKMGKIYKEHPLLPTIMQKFGNILSCLNQHELPHKIPQLTQVLPTDPTLATFIQSHKKHLISTNRPSFIGFSIEKTNFTNLYKIMYNFLKEVDTVGLVFLQALKMEEFMVGRMRKGDQRDGREGRERGEFMGEKEVEREIGEGVRVSDQVLFLSGVLERRLFSKFLAMYRNAVKYAKILTVTRDNLTHQIAFKPPKQPPHKIPVYTVKYNLSSNCWQCNCGFIYSSGIPCAHLIKIIRKFGGSLTYYINSRWVVDSGRRGREVGVDWGEDSGREVVSQVQEDKEEEKKEKDKEEEKDMLKVEDIQNGQIVQQPNMSNQDANMDSFINQLLDVMQEKYDQHNQNEVAQIVHQDQQKFQIQADPKPQSPIIPQTPQQQQYQKISEFPQQIIQNSQVKVEENIQQIVTIPVVDEREQIKNQQCGNEEMGGEEEEDGSGRFGDGDGKMEDVGCGMVELKGKQQKIMGSQQLSDRQILKKDTEQPNISQDQNPNHNQISQNKILQVPQPKRTKSSGIKSLFHQLANNYPKPQLLISQVNFTDSNKNTNNEKIESVMQSVEKREERDKLKE